WKPRHMWLSPSDRAPTVGAGEAVVAAAVVDERVHRRIAVALATLDPADEHRVIPGDELLVQLALEMRECIGEDGWLLAFEEPDPGELVRRRACELPGQLQLLGSQQA